MDMARALDSLIGAVAWLSRAAGVLSAVLLIGMVLHILLEIVLRAFFSTSTFVLDEFVGYGVAAMTFLSLAYALNEDALIRVNIVLARTRGRTRLAFEIFSVAVTLSITVFIAAYFWRSVARNWKRGAVSESIAEFPLWIPEGLVLAGMTLFAIQLAAYLLRLIAGDRKIIGQDQSGPARLE
ncbi:MAG: TRAP transporter small permease [Rhodospirillales bacterium]|nr:MAG: TRAP transporter small permease [Rhodospirillales bacterium]